MVLAVWYGTSLGFSPKYSPNSRVQAPEGPHIYRKDGYYYLMAAEGEPRSQCLLMIL